MTGFKGIFATDVFDIVHSRVDMRVFRARHPWVLKGTGSKSLEPLRFTSFDCAQRTVRFMQRGTSTSLPIRLEIVFEGTKRKSNEIPEALRQHAMGG